MPRPRFFIASLLALGWLACGSEPNEPVPTIELAADLPLGRIGESYEGELREAHGAGVLWEVQGLPTGLESRLRGTRLLIRGTPEEVGQFTLTIRMERGEERVTERAELIIAPGLIRIVTETLPDGRLGDPYEVEIEATAGYGTRAWTVEELPAGLRVEQGDVLRIVGTPTEPDRVSLHITVTTSEGDEDDRWLHFVIYGRPLTIEDVVLPVATANEPYRVPLGSSGGLLPLRWYVADPVNEVSWEALEDQGRSIAIVGTPRTVGRRTVRVGVLDEIGESVERDFVFDVVEDRMEIFTSTLSDAQIDQPYGTALAFRPGAGAHNGAVTAGALPNGITLIVADDTARLSGTPTELGPFTFTVTLQDERGQSASRGFELFVSEFPPLRIITTTLPVAMPGVEVDIPIEGTGGVGPYTWTVTGSVGHALVMDTPTTVSTRIHGRPDRVETNTFEVTLTDANQRRANRFFSLRISGPPPHIVNDALVIRRCQDLLKRIDSIGGSGLDERWSFHSGMLPGGVEFDPNDLVLVGVAQDEGRFDYELRLEDGTGRFDLDSTFVQVIEPEGLWGLITVRDGLRRSLQAIDLCSGVIAPGPMIHEAQGADRGVHAHTPVLMSPLGRRAAYVAEENGETRVFVVDLTTATLPRSAVSGPLVDPMEPVDLTWSPNGHRLGYVATTEVDRRVAYVADVASGGPALRVSPPGSNVVGRVVWSPDGARFALHGELTSQGTHEIGVAEVATATSSFRVVSGALAPGQSVSPYPPVWSYLGGRLFFVASLRPPRVEVFGVDVTTSPSSRPTPSAPTWPDA